MHDEYYGAPSTPTSDYLAHYGVLGMKWGIRRAAKKGLTYSYKSHATKKYEKAAAKLAAKAKQSSGEKAAKLSAKSVKMANRAKRSAQVDKGEEEFARNIKTGNALAISALVPGGANALKAYAQHRAMSGQKGNKFSGAKGMAAFESVHSGTWGSRTRKAGYIRQDEDRKGLNAWGHRTMEDSRKSLSGYAQPVATAGNKFVSKNSPSSKKKTSSSKKNTSSSNNAQYMEGLKKASTYGGIIGGTAYALKNRKKRR